ncbi:MAG TPA: hypothetical protein VD913_02210 [bacterium]|nr:hypothetical protein [bacterium]
MEDALLIVSGFGFLLAYGKSQERGPYTGKADFVSLLKEGFHLLWQVLALLLTFEFAVRNRIPDGYGDESRILFFFPAAYLLTAAMKKSVIFFACVFSLSFFTASHFAAAGWPAQLQRAAHLVAGVFLFEALLTGLTDKLLFCPVPKALEGLPILFVTAALVTLAAWGLQGILI